MSVHPNIQCRWGLYNGDPEGDGHLICVHPTRRECIDEALSFWPWTWRQIKARKGWRVIRVWIYPWTI